MQNLPAVRPQERTPASVQSAVPAVVASTHAGRRECSYKTRNAAAWTDIARFLVAQANPGLRYLGVSR